MMLFTAIGMILVLSPYYFIGFIMFGLAAICWKYHSTEKEELFVTFLAALAFLGVVAIFIEDFIGRWLLS